MQKKLIIISLVVIVALISAGYSIFLGNNGVEIADEDTNNHQTIAGIPVSNVDDEILSSFKVDALSVPDNAYLTEDNTSFNNEANLGLNNLINYVSGNSIYDYVSSDELDDRYIQCAVCGRLIPLGLHHTLSADAICNGVDKESVISIDNALSYDEAVNVWNIYLEGVKKSTYDNLSYYNSDYWHNDDMELGDIYEPEIDEESSDLGLDDTSIIVPIDYSDYWHIVDKELGSTQGFVDNGDLPVSELDDTPILVAREGNVY